VQTKTEESKVEKYKWNIEDLWDIIKRPNPWVIGIREEEVQTKDKEYLFNKRITENFPNLEKVMTMQVWRFSGLQTDKTRKESPQVVL
jgi:hypothetical protein